MWSSLRIRNKILLLFFVLSVIPLIIINVIWLQFSQGQLEIAAADRQATLIASTANSVRNALDEKIDDVTSTSQDINVTNLDVDLAKLKLLQFSSRDLDVVRVSLVDKAGDEKIVIVDGEDQEDLANVSETEPFQVVTLLGNEPRLGEVRYEDDQPLITISVPLLGIGQLGSQELSSSEALIRRAGADINGALIVDISLARIWEDIESTKLGDTGYLYLVDNQGELLVHPDKSVVQTGDDLSNVTQVGAARETLKAFDLETVADNFEATPSVTTSEVGETVLSSHFPISTSEWAIIGQEPISSVNAAVNRVSTTAAVILAVAIPVSLTLILLATRSVIAPIKRLTQGAIRLSQGDFSSQLAVKGKDELSVLAQSFNDMGSSLKGLLERLNKRNQELETEQTKLSAILDTVADGVLVLDDDYRIVLANKTMASFIGNAEPSSFIDNHWLDIFPLFFKDKKFTDELLENGSTFFHEVTLRSTDDHPKFIDITTRRLKDNPNGIAFILTIQDISQRIELEHMKMDFVSMAAHELRTPLTAIQGYINLIAAEDSNEEDRKAFVNTANSNSAILEGIINNMLSLSRIERNVLTLKKNKLNWSDIVAQEVKRLEFAASAKEITVHVTLPDEPMLAWGDDVGLREVLSNLLNNAIHYSEKGQPVSVTAVQTGDNIITTVSDKGSGIPQNLQGKLFTKYYRTRGGLATNSQGTGIGLYISKSIIDAHGGEISFKSEFNVGSDFYFTVEAYNEDMHRQTSSSDDTMGSKE